MKNRSFPPLSMGSRPVPTGLPNPTCPILLEARNVLEKTQDLERAIHKFRRSSQRCHTCPERSTCPTPAYFAQALDTAIRAVRREWGLDRDE
jgi:hypothetical protein